MSAHYVYRCYDDDGRLVYVGCTSNLNLRLRAHGYDEFSWWSGQVVKVKAKVYPDVEAGRRAEKQAIWTEHPRWNVKQRWECNRSDWTEADYTDYWTAIHAHYQPRPRHEYGYDAKINRRRVAALEAEYELKYGRPIADALQAAA